MKKLHFCSKKCSIKPPLSSTSLFNQSIPPSISLYVFLLIFLSTCLYLFIPLPISLSPSINHPSILSLPPSVYICRLSFDLLLWNNSYLSEAAFSDCSQDLEVVKTYWNKQKKSLHSCIMNNVCDFLE